VPHRSRLFFQIGCWAALATSAIHMAGVLFGTPPPANDTERTLRTLMDGYRFPLPGASRTMGELMQGLSISWSLFLALLSATGLSVARRASADALLLPALARMHAAAFIVLLVISITYWFLIPTVCIAVTTVAYVVAALPGGAPAGRVGTSS
jgi:hypothetical protein